MAARAGQAFIAVGPDFKGWETKQEAFVKSKMRAIKIPAELDVNVDKPLVVLPPHIKDPVIKPKVEQSRFRRGIAAIESRLDRLSRGRFLINVGIAAAPLAAPIAGVAAGGLLAGAGIGAAGLGGVGAFAGVGARSLKNIDDAQSAGKGLTAGQSAVATAKKSAGAGLDKLAGDPRVLGALTSGFTALGKAVAPLTAFLLPVSDALGQVFAKFGDAAASQGVAKFAADFGAFSGTILRDAGAGLMNLGKAFGNLLTAFMPLSSDMSTGLVDLTAKFAAWTGGLSKSAGFQKFVSYVRTNGPLLLSALGKLGSLLITVGVAAAPLGAKLLQVVNAVVPMIANFAQVHPLVIQVAVGIVSASSALAAFAGPAGQIIGLVNTMWTVLSKLWIVLQANPIGIVIAIIALLVVGFINAYKHSETFRNIVDGAMHGVAKAFTFLWDQAKKVFGWLADQWQKLVDLFNTPLKPKIEAADKTKNTSNSSGTRNRVVSRGGGLPANALGTDNWRGGLTWVGEKGPELAWLPSGTAITPNNRIGNLRSTANAFSVPVGRTKSMRIGDLRGGSLAGRLDISIRDVSYDAVSQLASMRVVAADEAGRILDEAFFEAVHT
jgi:hypothetical protein